MSLKIQLSIVSYNSTSCESIIKTPPEYKIIEFEKLEFKITISRNCILVSTFRNPPAAVKELLKLLF